ncbi:phenylacetaldoxime dehydratase family protein [Nocardia sp. NPDC059246]|uniref:phenylacetaldoxime dehydratase family protein n=1 Tax=unclassified Nocardia TaxID=2637762 RepID=UPI003680A124
MRVKRMTADLSEYPDLVVILLGMRVRKPRGILRLLGVGPKLYRSHHDMPDGLLSHEDVVWSLWPPHWGARQYWRDLESLERWTRSDPHRQWWQQFLRDSGGTGFWHEAYFARGGIDSVYDDMSTATGLARFARTVPARGRLFSTRGRVGDTVRAADRAVPEIAPVITESALYDTADTNNCSAIDLPDTNGHAHIPGALTCCQTDTPVNENQHQVSDIRPRDEHRG